MPEKSRIVDRRQDPVAIVGASAAGLFAACSLAKEGLPVCLFEEMEELGSPTRILIVTSSLGQAMGSIPSAAIVNRAPNLQLFSPRRSALIRLQRPDLILERRSLIQALAAQARAAGADIRLGCRFVGFRPGADGLLLTLRGAGGRVETLRTRTLIGADGVSSAVARAVNWRCHRRVYLLQAATPMPSWAAPDTSQVWFDPQTTRYFYWLIPQGGDRATVGLIADNERQAYEGLGRFLACHRLAASEYERAEVPLYSRGPAPCRAISGSRVLLVGDAGAQVKITTVGGVVTGLLGARAAVRAIAHGRGYGAELTALRRELDLHWLVRQILDGLAPAGYDALLELVDQRMEGALAAHTRDDMWPVLLSSLIAQPGLLGLAARALLRRAGAAARARARADYRASSPMRACRLYAPWPFRAQRELRFREKEAR